MRERELDAFDNSVRVRVAKLHLLGTLMAKIKETAKFFLPAKVVERLQKYRNKERLRRKLKPFDGLPLSQTFARIYDRGLWGSAPREAQKYYSGSGSHLENVVDCYVDAVRQFLVSLAVRPNVVDLGCGDFSVGSRIRPLCGNYIACDVVEPLIAFDKAKYDSLGVDFRVLDLTKDRVPLCDVLFVRQVLQHLSNKHIKRALPRLTTCCKHLVLTEHLPLSDPFTPNVDITAGPEVRLELNSGVVLTRPPFKMKALEEKTLCEVSVEDGRIRTTLFRFGSPL
jgi:hypothetical protein